MRTKEEKYEDDGAILIWLVGFLIFDIMVWCSADPMWFKLALTGFLVLISVALVVVTPIIDAIARRDANESFYQITGIRPDEDEEE